MSDPTTDEMFAMALRRLEEVRAENEALQKFIKAYVDIAQGRASAPSESESHQPSLYEGATRKARKERIAQTLEAARHLMISEGRPMKRGEVVKKLQAQGYEIEGADKNKVFGTNMWRSGEFDTVEGRGYWPKDRPLPKQEN